MFRDPTSEHPRALVIRTAGTNCDAEMVRAFRLAGADTDLIHLDRLIERPRQVDDFDLIGFPGGFSYGDDIASGRILAMKLREFLYPALRDAASRGVPMIGACNGFQALVQVGLLPGPDAGQPWPQDRAPAQRVALTDNIQGRFVDDWIPIAYEASNCIWTRHLAGLHAVRPDAALLPVAHGEGRFVTDTPATLAALERGGQIAVRYIDNFNGSEAAIAGICDPSGRVFGLMPHPERFLDWTRHPYWTALDPAERAAETPGLSMFRAAVEAVTGVHS